MKAQVPIVAPNFKEVAPRHFSDRELAARDHDDEIGSGVSPTLQTLERDLEILSADYPGWWSLHTAPTCPSHELIFFRALSCIACAGTSVVVDSGGLTPSFG